MSNGLRYQEGAFYLLSSAKFRDVEYFGEEKNYFTITTEHNNVSYHVTFKLNGESPLGRTAVCKIIEPVG